MQRASRTSRAQGLITHCAVQGYAHRSTVEGPRRLQVEAKASAAQTAALARGITEHGDMGLMPTPVAKEIEYVLDLQPSCLWVVGPGSIEPAKFVFEVDFAGGTPLFTRITDLPAPPKA